MRESSLTLKAILGLQGTAVFGQKTPNSYSGQEPADSWSMDKPRLRGAEAGSRADVQSLALYGPLRRVRAQGAMNYVAPSKIAGASAARHFGSPTSRRERRPFRLRLLPQLRMLLVLPRDCCGRGPSALRPMANSNMTRCAADATLVVSMEDADSTLAAASPGTIQNA